MIPFDFSYFYAGALMGLDCISVVISPRAERCFHLRQIAAPDGVTDATKALADDCTAEFILFGQGQPFEPPTPRDVQEKELVRIYRGLRSIDQGTLLTFARMLYAGPKPR
ncbi:MAG: hypothetical protein IIA03_03640 [Proteobacteria bacterium]|nr:hypothetical protein [Pseudomonadota bacterium]